MKKERCENCGDKRNILPEYGVCFDCTKDILKQDIEIAERKLHALLKTGDEP